MIGPRPTEEEIMSHPGVPYQRTRGGSWGVVLALIAGAIVFAVLVGLTAGYLLALLFAVIVMIIVGGLHYLVWGRAMAQAVPAGRVVMPPPARIETPPDLFTVTVNDQERAVLLRLLNQLEAERRAVPAPQDATVLHRLRDKLQSYGA
jgi:hypothetical protein